MRTLLLALTLLAIAAPVALADAPDPAAALRAVPPDFVACSMYHVGLFLATGAWVHLTHPVTICLL